MKLKLSALMAFLMPIFAFAEDKLDSGEYGKFADGIIDFLADEHHEPHNEKIEAIYVFPLFRKFARKNCRKLLFLQNAEI